jgi:hypothetical protein
MLLPDLHIQPTYNDARGMHYSGYIASNPSDSLRVHFNYSPPRTASDPAYVTSALFIGRALVRIDADDITY